MSEPRPTFAAVVHGPGVLIDELLARFASDLAGRGLKVRGLVQDNRDVVDGCACTMELVDVADGRRYRISQDLGSGSTSCRIDPAGVAAASVALERAATEGAGLVVVNRFGGLERDGKGLAADMLAVMAAGIPLLTAVPERYFQDWQRFSGGLGATLAPRRQALEGWVASIVAMHDY